MFATALAVAAAGWGVVMALSPLLQVRRILRQGSSREVSIGYFCLLLVGFALWVAYGVSTANQTVVVPNSIAFMVGCLTIGVSARHRLPKRAEQER
jgi:MtN3 and saliva related transmembrane protein